MSDRKTCDVCGHTWPAYFYTPRGCPRCYPPTPDERHITRLASKDQENNQLAKVLGVLILFGIAGNIVISVVRWLVWGVFP